MTEAEWLACDDPNKLLNALDATKWKTELAAFAEACLRVHKLNASGEGESRGWSVRAVPRSEQVQLIRCLCGNPFMKVKMHKDWRTDTVRALVRTMYESREFGAMPILADALQDAGCDSDDILNHCRGVAGGGSGEPVGGSPVQARHVRGCWVCDLVLGKE